MTQQPEPELETKQNENVVCVERFHELTLVSEVNHCQTKIPQGIYKTIQKEVAEGLDVILNHFLGDVWPRNISTRTAQGKQVLVSSKEEALARFAQANYQDCRISAYPPNAEENPSAIERFQGFDTITPRNIIVIMDLDRSNFKTDRALHIALSKTLHNIKTLFNVRPTTIFSGNGYHVYLSLDSNNIVLENVKQFSDLKVEQISVKFLRFVETYLSAGKSDIAHNTTVSFNNSMMRIPASINSKNGHTVVLQQMWDNNRPAINILLPDFCVYLVNKKAQELIKKNLRKNYRKTQYAENENDSIIEWIETLLQTPIADHRKYCVWRILVPYLVNRRKVSEEECINTITAWLEECNKLQRLNFNANQKINYVLKSVGDYKPIHPDKLKEECLGLYNLLG